MDDEVLGGKTGPTKSNAGNNFGQVSNTLTAFNNNPGGAQIDGKRNISRFFGIAFLGSAVVFFAVLILIIMVVWATPLGSLVKRGGVIVIAFLILVDFAIFKIMLLPVIKGRSDGD